MDFTKLTCFKNLTFMLAVVISLAAGQTASTTPTTDPALFFAIIVVVAIIAVILIGAVISLIIICIIYYCCTPVPNPDHVSNVRTNPNSGEQMEVVDPLPPDYADHEKYPKNTLSQRSRASLPRYSVLFKKTRRNRDSERSVESPRSRGISSVTQSLPEAIETAETSQAGMNTV